MKKKTIVAMLMALVVLAGTPVVVPMTTEAATTTVKSKTQLSDADVAILSNAFDSNYYATQYPDVVKTYGSSKEQLFKHFIEFGLDEGRSINADFNVLAYQARYSDLQKAFGNDYMAYYRHYVNYGIKEGRVGKTVATSAKTTTTTTTTAATKKATLDEQIMKDFDTFNKICDYTKLPLGHFFPGL